MCVCFFTYCLYFLCLFVPMNLHLPSLKGPYVLPLYTPPPCFWYYSPAVTMAIKAMPQQACNQHPEEGCCSGSPANNTHALSSIPLNFFFLHLSPLHSSPDSVHSYLLQNKKNFLQCGRKKTESITKCKHWLYSFCHWTPYALCISHSHVMEGSGVSDVAARH